MILIIFIIGFMIFELGKLTFEEILGSDDPILIAQILGIIILIIGIAALIAC